MARLILDFSKKAARLAADNGPERRATHESEPGRNVSARLASVVTELLARVGATTDAVDALFVVRGPGSFTGLRVALAFAGGFARASGARVVPLPIAEALALMYAPATGRSTVAVALDAMRKEAYCATVTVVDGRPAGPAAWTILPAAEVPAFAARCDLRLVDPALGLPREPDWGDPHPDPFALPAAAAGVETALGPQAASPIYVRKSAAREKKDSCGEQTRGTPTIDSHSPRKDPSC